MFFALQLNNWSQHAFTRLALGMREDGTFSKTRGILPDIFRGFLLAGAFVGALHLWNWKMGPTGWMSLQVRLAPLALVLSPIPLAFVMGFTRAWAAARQAKRDPMVQQLSMSATDLPEIFYAFTVGVAFKSLIFLSCYFQALICLMATDSQIFSPHSSLFFLLLMSGTSLFLGGSLVLDYAILLALKEEIQGRGAAVALFLVLPYRLLQTLLVLLLGAGIGGLGFLATRIDKLESELENAYFDPERFETGA